MHACMGDSILPKMDTSLFKEHLISFAHAVCISGDNSAIKKKRKKLATVKECYVKF